MQKSWLFNYRPLSWSSQEFVNEKIQVFQHRCEYGINRWHSHRSIQLNYFFLFLKKRRKKNGLMHPKCTFNFNGMEFLCFITNIDLICMLKCELLFHWIGEWCVCVCVCVSLCDLFFVLCSYKFRPLSEGNTFAWNNRPFWCVLVMRESKLNGIYDVNKHKSGDFFVVVIFAYFFFFFLVVVSFAQHFIIENVHSDISGIQPSPLL